MSKPTLLFRIHNYNKVSMGALLGAATADILKEFKILFWTSSEELPENQLTSKVLYIHSFMLMHVGQISAELELIKKSFPQIEFLAGGAQPSAAPERTLKMGFDFVFCGEGEIDFPVLLQNWLESKLEKGIHRQSDQKVVLDDFPGFSPLIDYLPPIEISRGCNFGCMYCGVPGLYKGKVKHRSVSSVLNILEKYYKIKSKRKRMKFLTPNAFGYASNGKLPNITALQNLLESVKRFGVSEILFGSFPGEVRPDFVTREVMETITPYAKNKTIVMGVQSGNDSMLKKMNRGHTVEQAVNAISLIRKFGFTPHVDFIIGNPGETPQDRIDLVDFMELMIKRFQIKIHMHAFMPLPATAWQNLNQTPIEPEIHKRLKQLANSDSLDGWWENQIGLGRNEMQLSLRKDC